MTGYFIQAFIYLAAAVIFVPIAKRLGLGSVLGYLIAGVVIGPIIGLVGSETSTIQHFAEFGVVMMLFLVGLELEPKTLWQMRNRLLGLGGLQVGLTAAAFTFIALQFNHTWTTGLAIGLIFAMSSTAIVLQTFNEKGLSKTEGGKNAFQVLLFQDIAVIPMLAFIPLLAVPELQQAAQNLASAADHHDELNFVANLSPWVYALVIVASISVVILGGHYLSRPLFKYIASTGLRESFVATALLLIIGIAALMSLVGLSPALGAFLAGVVLANSEFRHELESNLEPFKGLLLGLFFITVGAGINFSILAHNLFTIVGVTLLVIIVKAGVLFLLATIFKVKGSDRWLFALSLAQAGEFGFVLLSFTLQNHVLPLEIVQILQLVVALSMFITPALFIAFEKIILPKYQQQSNQQEAEDFNDKGTVLIAGIGRFGQIVNRLLVANKIKTVVLDHQANQVDNLRKINIKSYFGDATRPDLLHTAGIEDAKIFVIAIDNQKDAITAIKYAKQNYPHLCIFARAFDRLHAHELKLAGADVIITETFHSALHMGSKALQQLGFSQDEVQRKTTTFEVIEKCAALELYDSWKQASEGERFSQDYLKLFIKLEESIHKAMQDENYLQNHKCELSEDEPLTLVDTKEPTHPDQDQTSNINTSTDSNPSSSKNE